MSAEDQNRLSGALLRGRLTAQQEKEIEDYLAAHPAEREFWEEELCLNQLLRQMPDAPVSSNFTALVLAQLRHESARATVQTWSETWFRRWLPRLTSGLAVVGLGLFTYHEHQLSARQHLAEQLAQIVKLAPEPSLELLENFDAINRLNQVPRNSDRELIAALQ